MPKVKYKVRKKGYAIKTIKDDPVKDDPIKDDPIKDDLEKKNNNLKNNNLKTREFVDDIIAIKCKLNSIVRSSELIKKFRNRAFLDSKIVTVGIQLFTVYINFICSKHHNMPIDLNTIRRCVRALIKDCQGSREIKRKDLDDAICNLYENGAIDYLKVKHFQFVDFYNDFVNSHNAMMKPIEACCDTYFTNLKQHIQSNFKKYQKRYLITKLKNALIGHDIAYPELGFIIYAIQNRVNGNNNYSYEVEERNTKFNEIINKTDEIKNIIIKFIKDEKKIVEKTIHCEIDKDKVIKVLPNSRIIEYLQYFYDILKELNRNNVRGFPLVPQFKTNVKHFRFDSRSFCDIYEEWKNIKVGTDNFDKNYNMYFDEMFLIRSNKKYRHTLKKYPDIRSISTDGYAVTILFERIKKVTYTPKTDIEKEQIEKETEKNINKKREKKEIILKDLETEINKCIQNPNGRLPTLFDARCVKTTEEYLNKYTISGNDPGNDLPCAITTEEGKHITINKNYINDLSHTTRNRELLKKHDETCPEKKEVDENLAASSKKVAGIEEYMKYVTTVSNNWINIWKYGEDEFLLEIKFNGYVFKNKAYSRVAKEIVEAIKNDKNIYARHEKYFDGEAFDKNKDKPIMIAFGTGNGSGTISNTKGSTPKGAIKRLMIELSKLVVVIATPETNTSKLCCFCHKYLKDVEVYSLIPKDKYKEENKKGNYEKPIEERIELTKEMSHIIHEHKQEKYEQKIGVREHLTESAEDIKKYKEQLFQMGCYRKSYRLHRCAEKHRYNTDHSILIERNVNASINMPQLMRLLLTTQNIGFYKKK